MMIKTVDGYTSDGYGLEKRKVTVRVTSDKTGETLSLEDGRTLIGVGVKDIEYAIKQARKGKQNGR